MIDQRSIAATPFGRTRAQPRAKRPGAQSLRAQGFRLLKFPLLGRYAVTWRWPRTVDLRAWERISFASRSGARLAGLFGTATSERKGVVVCAHPLRRDAKSYFMSSGRADVLRRNGYDVLLFDFNGFGESSHGDFNYVQDVLAAADYAYTRARGLPVHALAACFGAVWTLSAATQDHPFSAIVVEAPFTSLQKYYANAALARAFYGLLCRVFPKSAANATSIDTAGRLAGTPRLLIIGGVEYNIAPIDMSQELYEACNLPRSSREIWCVAGAEHLRAFEAAPKEYEQRVGDFLDGASIQATNQTVGCFW